MQSSLKSPDGLLYFQCFGVSSQVRPWHMIWPSSIEAHRGGRALLPENTLPAFANALSMGVDTLELDVGITADNVLVIPTSGA